MKKFLSVILTVLLLVTSMPFACAQGNVRGNFESFYIKTIVGAMADNYKFGISEGEIYDAVMDYVLTQHPELLEGMLEAAASTMDEHTYYMPAEVLDEFYEYVDNSYVGIGVTVERVKEAVMISEVRRGGPADLAGLIAGDLIICVNGENVTNLDINSVSQKVRGEAGTTVELTIRRGEEEFNVVCERKLVKVGSVTHEIDNERKVGYIYISSFNSTTKDGVSEALTSFGYQDIKNVIIDLRNNPGGELDAALNTLSMFVPKNKVLVNIVGADGRETKLYSQANFNKLKYELVVIVNENSASAAELFAGAIRDNKAGTVIGTKTYGKGTVQTMMNLKNPEGHNLGDIKLTTAEYFLPSGDSVNKKGVRPDIIVKNEEVPLNDGSFSELEFRARYFLGDVGEGVLAIKERLSALGLLTGEVNDVFDIETEEAVWKFQKITGLFPYGVMDITTQNFLQNTFNEATKIVDRQIEAAYDFLTTDK